MGTCINREPCLSVAGADWEREAAKAGLNALPRSKAKKGTGRGEGEPG